MECGLKRAVLSESRGKGGGERKGEETEEGTCAGGTCREEVHRAWSSR